MGRWRGELPFRPASGRRRQLIHFRLHPRLPRRARFRATVTPQSDKTHFMKTIFQIVRPLVFTALTLTNFAASILAQEVSIPDPNFNAVIREALQKPNGPLTQTDMLGLTNLGAIFRNIINVQGLEAAQN